VVNSNRKHFRPSKLRQATNVVVNVTCRRKKHDNQASFPNHLQRSDDAPADELGLASQQHLLESPDPIEPEIPGKEANHSHKFLISELAAAKVFSDEVDIWQSVRDGHGEILSTDQRFPA